MSEADEIDRLDERVTRLENHVSTRLDSMDEKLHAISLQLAARRECPTPGACLELRPIVDRHETAIMNLRLWQSGMMAVILCLGFVVAPLFTILGPAIRIKLGLP